MAPPTTQAVEEVWIAPDSGLFSNYANWLDGSAPPVFGANDLRLRFNISGDEPITATNDIGSVLFVNSFDLTNNNPQLFTIADAAIAPPARTSFRLAGSAPRIEFGGISTTAISSDISVQPDNGVVTIAGTGLGGLSLKRLQEVGGSPVSLVIDAPARTIDTHVVSLGSSTHSGGTTIESGNVWIGASAGSGSLTINGGTVRFSGGTASNFALNTDLTIVAANDATLSGVISSATSGTGLNVLSSGTALTLTGTSTYDGPTVMGFGPLAVFNPQAQIVLKGKGSILNSSSYEIQAGAQLVLENGPSNPLSDNRLSDTAPVNLRSGNLVFNGTQTQTEKVGAVRSAGYSVVAMRSATLSSRSVQITAASIERVERGTFRFEGFQLGNSPGNQTHHFFLETPPADLVGGGGTGPETSIIPYATGFSANAFTSLVTYSQQTGIRPLNLDTEFTTNLSGATSTQNVRLTGSVTNNAALTVNSLLLDSANGILGGTGTLSIASGTIFSRQGQPIIRNDLSFGATEAIVFVSNELAINGVISGANGLTKSGNGTLELGGANTFTGPLTINSGLIRLSSPANLGGDSSPIILNGARAGLQYEGAGPLVIERPMDVRTGLGWFDAGSQSSAGSLQLNGVISGVGGLYLGNIDSNPAREIHLNAANTYTGPTVLDNGHVTIVSDASFGAGGDLALNGVLTLAGDWNATRRISVSGVSTVNTAGFDANWHGLLTGSAELIKGGEGTLRIASENLFAGDVTVEGGTFALADEGRLLSTRTVRVGSGAILSLDNVAQASNTRLRDTVTVLLTGGRLFLRGHAGDDMTQRMGSIATQVDANANTIELEAPDTGSVKLALDTLMPLGASLLLRANDLGGKERLVVSVNPNASNPVVPGIYLSESTSDTPHSFAIYDPTSDARGTIGFRGLRPSEIASGSVIQNPANGGTTPLSANFLAIGPTTATGALNAINSLTLEVAAGLDLTAGQSLQIVSGGILAREGSQPSISGGTIDLGSGMATIYTGGETTISSAITGDSFRKLGPETLHILGPVDLNGPLMIEEGRIRPDGNAGLASTAVQVGSAGVLDLNGASASVGALHGNGRVNIGSTTKATLTIGDAAQDTDFSGTIAGTGGLIIGDAGNDSALRRFSGMNTFAGGVVLEGGRLEVAHPSALGTGVLTVNGGALFTDSGQTINNPLTLNANVRFQGTGQTILSPRAGANGAGGVEVWGSGGLEIQSAAGYTGETRTVGNRDELGSTAPGPIALTGAKGALTATAAIRVAPGSQLLIDNTVVLSGGATGRIPDAAPVYLNQSEFRLSGNSATSITETTGALHGTGYSTVSVARAGFTNVSLHAAGLEREERATFLFRGTNLGTAAANIMVATSPTADLVGGGGVGPDTSILPYAIGDTDAAGYGSSLVTYDAVQGIRPLHEGTDYAVSLASAAPTNNVRLGFTETLSAPRTINALKLAGGAIEGSETLTITSGTIMKGGTNSASISTDLDFGTRSANIFVPGPVDTIGFGPLTLTGTIHGSAGLTKTGSTDLVLSGDNQIIGPITVQSGRLVLATPVAIGADSNEIVLNGGGIVFQGHDVHRPIRLSGYGSSIGNRGDTPAVINSVISGDGNLIVDGIQPVTLAAANTYTGMTQISGRVGIVSDASFGAGKVVKIDGTGIIDLLGDWTTNRTLEFAQNSRVTFNTEGFDAEMNGPITGNAGGLIFKIGEGNLRIGDGGTNTVSVIVKGGVFTGFGEFEQADVGVNAVLAGDANFHTLIALEGTLAPGESVGVISAKDISFKPNSKLEIELASRTNFDRLTVFDSVVFNGLTDLDLDLAFDPVDFVDSFMLVEHGGSSPVEFRLNPAGFAIDGVALNEGDRFLVDAQEFSITYAGGDGNDVVLYAIPEPGCASLLWAGVVFCFRRKLLRC